jgi:cytochrome c-type biogenesis protein CcmH/NrfG
VVRQAGRLDEAQSLAQEVLALLQGQLGSEHPRVAAQLMMLGQLAAQQGKQAAAEQTYRKALQVGGCTYAVRRLARKVNLLWRVRAL